MTKEIRYYISSNRERVRVSQGIMSHWEIENNLHWQLDVTMNEDKLAKRNGYAAENFSLFNKLILNLLKKR